METKNVKDIGHYVDSKRTTNFLISSIPVNIYKEFKVFAINMAGDNYAMAIKVLLDSYNYAIDKNEITQLQLEVSDLIYKLNVLAQDQKEMDDIQQAELKELRQIVDSLVNTHEDTTQTTEESVKTFGSKK